MKQYDVKISHAALSDMEQIYSYIADRLLEPDTAMGQYNRIAEAIQSLNILPERCALLESEPERTQGLRQMLVDNYSVFYIVGEDTVSVARVLYSASDLVRRLRRMKRSQLSKNVGQYLLQILPHVFLISSSSALTLPGWRFPSPAGIWAGGCSRTLACCNSPAP